MDEKIARLVVWDRQTPEEKTRVLTALRDGSATLPDPAVRDAVPRNGIQSLVLWKPFQSDLSFEETAGRIDRSGLSPEDLEFFVRQHPANCIDPSEIGPWVGWLIEKFPAEKYPLPLKSLLEGYPTASSARAWLESLSPDEAERVRIYLVPIDCRFRASIREAKLSF